MSLVPNEDTFLVIGTSLDTVEAVERILLAQTDPYPARNENYGYDDSPGIQMTKMMPRRLTKRSQQDSSPDMVPILRMGKGSLQVSPWPILMMNKRSQEDGASTHNTGPVSDARIKIL